ncbi:MAG: alpha/beta hydrolase [Bacteroidota bacterium]
MKSLLPFLLLCFTQICFAQKTVYFIPGTGADGRLFERIQIEQYDTVWLEYLVPEKQENFDHYINRMAAEIDTSENYSIVGVSLGGMIATELADRLNPDEVIVIAGAKQASELPDHYHLFRYLPLHRVLGGRTMIWGTKLMQPLFEPMEEQQQEVFRSMISLKSPHFIKSAVRWMINWDRDSYRSDIYHIHGAKDRTLPIKNVEADYIVEEGGHMITYDRAEEISALLNEVIK